MESNFGIQKEDGYTFQPDFLIKFKDGRLGIFDTKGAGDREEDNKEKATALIKYLEEETTKGKNLIGGLVITISYLSVTSLYASLKKALPLKSL